MLLIKALEGTYKQKDIFDNGSEILSLFNTSGIEYHVDMEFIEHCKNWDKASFAKLNKNPKFTSAYQKHYKTSKALTLVWLNAILKNPEEITDFEDNVAILDRIITHDKTKPEEEVLPIPDLTIEESIEEIPSIESEEDIFTVSQIDESGFEGLEEVHETEEVPSFAPVEPTIPVESEDIFSPVITREEIEGLTSKENKTEESDVVQPEPFEFISSEGIEEIKESEMETSPYIQNLQDENFNIEEDEIQEVDEVAEFVPVTMSVQESNQDVVFEYNNEIPNSLKNAVIELIKSDISFIIKNTNCGYTIEIN